MLVGLEACSLEMSILLENAALVASMIVRLTFQSYVLDMHEESYRLEKQRKPKSRWLTF